MEIVSEVFSKVILFNLYYLIPELLVSYLLIEVSAGSYLIRFVSWIISGDDLPKIIRLPIVAAFALTIFLVVPPIISTVAGASINQWILGLPALQMISLGIGLLTFNISYTMWFLGADPKNPSLLLIVSIAAISIFVFITSTLGII